jgi:nucleoid-associated protein EbfC
VANQNQKQINQMMRQVQKMQADMAAAQEALQERTVEGSAGGGMVTVVINGSGDVQSVHIDPGVVDPDDVEMLEDLVLAAIGDGLRRAQELQAESLGGVAGGLDLGSLGGLLG